MTQTPSAAGPNSIPQTQITAKPFTFVLVPEFSMIAFTAAIEPLRAANRVAGKQLYTWQVATVDGEPVIASNGVQVQPDTSLDEAPHCEVLIVCAGLNPIENASDALAAKLRMQARHCDAVGGVCTGSMLLAKAGLLEGYRCTIHWENLIGFTESFPDLEITSRLYEIDRNRFTCSGGITPLDMMIHFIALDFGRKLATDVAELMVHHFAREAHEPQRLSILERTGVRHPKLLRAIELMEASIELPVSLEKIAAQAELSARQMERLFQMHFQSTPSRYYLKLRLGRAQHLLRHTSMSVVEIALASGFASQAHFTKCYRESYGNTPRAERQPPVKERLPKPTD